MTHVTDKIVDVPGYGDKCATYREACDDAKQFAQDFGCDAWVARYDSDSDNVWKVMGPATAVSMFVQRQRQLQLQADQEYMEGLEDFEHELARQAWLDRYGTPWSPP
jgi:hypothetical protein